MMHKYSWYLVFILWSILVVIGIVNAYNTNQLEEKDIKWMDKPKVTIQDKDKVCYIWEIDYQHNENFPLRVCRERERGVL